MALPKITALAAALATASLVSGCVSVVYKTVPEDGRSMDVLAAYKTVEDAAKAGVAGKGRCARLNWDTSWGGPASFSLDGDGLTLVCSAHDGSPVSFRFPYAKTPLPKVDNSSAGTYVTLISDDGGTWPVLGVRKDQREQAVRLAKAWSVLARPPTGEPEGFEEAARGYLSAAVPPELPEAARRFKIEAELAVKEKKFIDAAIAYRDGLKAAPWWPHGRYNSALVLAELGFHGEAAREMGRYLALKPDAANARAAQDQIYAWEAKARKK